MLRLTNVTAPAVAGLTGLHKHRFPSAMLPVKLSLHIAMKVFWYQLPQSLEGARYRCGGDSCDSLTGSEPPPLERRPAILEYY